MEKNLWKKLLYCSSAALSALVLQACREPSLTTAPLAVTSFAAGVRGNEDAPALRLRFNQPIVDEEEVGKLLKDIPLRLTPAAPVSAYWEDRQTLVATPKQDLTPSTSYQVELLGPLSEQLAVPTFTFVAKPVAIDGYDGFDPYRAPVKPEITLTFNQQVNSEEVAKRCLFVLSGTKQSVGATTPQKKLDTRVTVTPQKALQQGQQYELRCEKIVGAVGTAAMDKPYSLVFSTYPTLQLTSVTPGPKDVVPSDGVKLVFTFTTSIDTATLLKSIKTKPEIKNIDRGWWIDDGVYQAQVDLEPQTEYAITVDGSLTDIFSQKLGTTSVHRFKTGDARPKITMERGIYAVEDTSDGYAVWTRNIDTFEVTCAPVPKESVVKLLTTAMDYDPWYDAEYEKLDWTALGLKQRKSNLSVKEQKNKWHLNNLNLKDTCGGTSAKGLYLAEVRSDQAAPPDSSEYSWRYKPYHRVLANVTNLGALMKIGPASGLIWVTNFSDGKPVPEATVTIYTPKGDKVFQGKTDKSGVLTTPGSAKLKPKKPATANPEGEEDFGDGGEYDWRPQRLIAVIESDKDMAVLDGNWSNGIQTWNFGVQQDYDLSGTTKIRGFIQSDRGIYRPGESVGFKGLVREIALGKSPSVPTGQKVQVRIEDPRGATVYEKSLDVTAFGGFSFDLALGEEAPLGDYYVSATIKDQTFRESFLVEEFKKVSYELSLKSDSAKAATLGDAVSFKLDANYLFGAPVTGAKVNWSVQRRRHYVDFPGYYSYNFEDYASRGDDWWFGYSDYGYLDFVADGEGETDKSGTFAFSVKDPQTNLSQPQDYVARVTVTDQSDEVISKEVAITAHKNQYYVGIHPQEYVQAVAMPFAVNTVALSPDGKRIGAKGTLRYVRWKYECTYTGAGPYSYDCKSKQEEIFKRSIEIPATGNGTEKITPEEPGQYAIIIESTDSKGNKISASAFVYVLGKGEAFWSGDESARMSLLASKESFAPGETAKLVPKTSISGGTALLTLERDGILSAKVVTLESSGQGVEVPLKGEHAPNVYASLAIVKGRTGNGDKNRPKFQMGVVELKVPAENHKLNVSVSTEQTSYEPGQEVSGVIRVTSNGKPVSAEVSLSVADEGVLQLIAYQTPDPMKAFYATWGLGVENATTWNRIARRYNPADMDVDEGGDSGSSGIQVRSKFVSSAYWQPALITDPLGEIHFKFTAPDNLTAFRLMAVAADKTDNFGSSDARITVKKSLQATPNLPRFLSSGDKATVGVVVYNYTPQSGDVVVTAEAKNFSLDSTTQTVKVDSNGSARVRFNGTALDGKEASFTFKVKMEGYTDGLQMNLPIRRPLVTDRISLGKGAVKGSVSVPLEWKPGLLASESFVEVSVDATGLSELEGSLKYLIEYPYGCLEQTLSRLIPLVKVKDMATSLDMASLKGPNLDRFVKAGLAKLIRFQHSDGHFSLWQGGEPHPHLTVFAMYGLTEAKRSGLSVDETAYTLGISAIQQWVSEGKRNYTDSGEAATMAMAAYILANMGKPDTGLNAKLYEARKSLPVYGKAFLLDAMELAKGPAAQRKNLLSELTASIKTKGDVSYVQEEIPKGFSYEYYMSSDTRSTAIALSAILLADPKNASIDKLAEGLKQQQKAGGYWYNTQDNLFGLVALADYAKKKASTVISTKVMLGKKTLASETLKSGAVLRYKASLQDLSTGTLVITSNNAARYSARLTTVREEKAQKALDEGFGIKREYLDPKTEKPVASFKAGQLVKVRLSITARQSHSWVALVDPLPAGLEAVNPRLATSEPEQPKSNAGYYDYYDYYPFWTYVEMRDDRVLAFADDMWKGSFTYEYLARASTAGEFTAPPATIEAMYQPDVFGRTETAKVIVNP